MGPTEVFEGSIKYSQFTLLNTLGSGHPWPPLPEPLPTHYRTRRSPVLLIMQKCWSRVVLSRCMAAQCDGRTQVFVDDRRRDADQHNGQRQRAVHVEQQIRGGVHVDTAAVSPRTDNRWYARMTRLLIYTARTR